MKHSFTSTIHKGSKILGRTIVIVRTQNPGHPSYPQEERLNWISLGFPQPENYVGSCDVTDPKTLDWLHLCQYTPFLFGCLVTQRFIPETTIYTSVLPIRVHPKAAACSDKFLDLTRSHHSKSRVTTCSTDFDFVSSILIRTVQWK